VWEPTTAFPYSLVQFPVVAFALRPFHFFPSPFCLRSSSRSRSLRAQSLPRASPFFEYNLQTPLNARSRFKPPGNRRAPLYQGVKISWPPREGGRGSRRPRERATLSRNSPGQPLLYPLSSVRNFDSASAPVGVFRAVLSTLEESSSDSSRESSGAASQSNCLTHSRSRNLCIGRVTPRLFHGNEIYCAVSELIRLDDSATEGL